MIVNHTNLKLCVPLNVESCDKESIIHTQCGGGVDH